MKFKEKLGSLGNQARSRGAVLHRGQGTKSPAAEEIVKIRIEMMAKKCNLMIKLCRVKLSTSGVTAYYHPPYAV